MSSKMFFGASSEYRSQREQDKEIARARVSGFYDIGKIGGALIRTDAGAEAECQYCGKLHKWARKFCGLTCARAFIKSQQRKGKFTHD
jgi:hypothetical protein